MGPALPQALSPFLEDTPQYLLDLETAVHGENAQARSAKAHAIKGSSGNLGANTLAQLAKEAEEHAIAGRLELIVPLLPRLRIAYNAVANMLAGEVAPHDATARPPRTTSPRC
jgi:HPt (histidine-containing phosphotransfer) domain-containing protein